MTWLYNSAITEVITALIIWALIERFGRVAKSHGRLHSVGVFLAAWVVVTVAHMILLPEPLASLPPQAPTADRNAVDAKDTAKFEANKPELLAIAQQVIYGAQVDQQTHSRFWSLIPASVVNTPERRQEAIDGFDLGIHTQKEFWESILLSAQAHQVVKTQAYEDASRQVDPTNAHALTSEAMLEAAASGSPYTLQSGKGTVVITETYAKGVLSNLDASSARLKILFDPAWHP